MPWSFRFASVRASLTLAFPASASAQNGSWTSFELSAAGDHAGQPAGDARRGARRRTRGGGAQHRRLRPALDPAGAHDHGAARRRHAGRRGAGARRLRAPHHARGVAGLPLGTHPRRWGQHHARRRLTRRGCAAPSCGFGSRVGQRAPRPGARAGRLRVAGHVDGRARVRQRRGGRGLGVRRRVHAVRVQRGGTGRAGGDPQQPAVRRALPGADRVDGDPDDPAGQRRGEPSPLPGRDRPLREVHPGGPRGVTQPG